MRKFFRTMGWLAGVLLGAAIVSPSSGQNVSASKPSVVAVKDLPVIKEMPDPLTMNDGTKVTTVEQWRKRRGEMQKILEDFEYGHMPPAPAAPGNVRGKEVSSKELADGTKYRLIHLTFGPAGWEDKLGFDMGIFSPKESAAVKGPFPTIISLSFSASETGARQYQAALARGYAVAAMGIGQMGADNPNYRKTGFFPAYPEYDWNDFGAWAWGISRAVDYLETDAAVDKTKIAATGVSRLGQAVLLAGAFDERIALVAPVAGGMALRFSGKERGGGQGIDEVVAQNTYWFGPRFEEFKGQTDRLPCDQHWLLALAAPRCYILCNSLADQYGNANAAAQTYLAAKPVYAFLGVSENLGVNFRPGMHGMNAADWSAILVFADVHFKKAEAKRRFDELPPKTAP